MSRIKLTINRLSERARKSARGTMPPAGTGPAAAPSPDGRERRLIRQRLRRTRRVRDARLAELGLVVTQMQSRGRWNHALVEEWTSELEIADRERTELDQALRGERPLSQLVATGLVGQCDSCGRIAGAADRFCAGCGRELGAGNRAPAGEPDPGKTLTIP
jgi:hypothetical protein